MEAVLFHCPQMAGLAKRICALDKRITLGNVRWKKFDDGENDIDVYKAEGIRQKKAVLLCSFDTDTDQIQQLDAMYTIPRQGA
ncbi:MAG: ribose-phosphate diphosphokinase, partial [Candidatus Parcubacteria bacterium]